MWYCKSCREKIQEGEMEGLESSAGLRKESEARGRLIKSVMQILGIDNIEKDSMGEV